SRSILATRKRSNRRWTSLPRRTRREVGPSHVCSSPGGPASLPRKPQLAMGLARREDATRLAACKSLPAVLVKPPATHHWVSEPHGGWISAKPGSLRRP